MLCGGASAAIVDFSTVGALNCGSAANCAVVGNVLQFGSGASNSPTLTISYTSSTQNDVSANPFASTNFGAITVGCLFCSGVTETWDIAGATLSITINQGPDPFAQSAVAFQGTFSGGLRMIGGNVGGIAAVSFGTTPITATFSNQYPIVTYIMQQPIPPPVSGYAISLNNSTTLQGFVQTDVPEPATYALMTLGLGVLGLAHRRRTRHS